MHFHSLNTGKKEPAENVSQEQLRTVSVQQVILSAFETD